MNPILVLIFSTGGAAVITTIINAITQHKVQGREAEKLSGEATKVITEAAGSVVKDIKEDNERLRKENEELRQLAHRLEKRVATLEVVVNQWGEWGSIVEVHVVNPSFVPPKPQVVYAPEAS